MKKILFLLCLFGCLLETAEAQTSTITATITDSDGTTWASLNGYSATYVIQLQDSSGNNIRLGQAYRKDNNSLVPVSYIGTMDSTGSLSVTLTSNSYITPANTVWNFYVCPAVNPLSYCFRYTQAINASQSLSTQLSAQTVAPRIGGGIGNYAYADVEVNAIANSSYLNVTSNTLRCYTTSWGSCGGGGGGSGTVTNVSVVTANGVSGTVANPSSTPAITLLLGAINPTSIGQSTPAPGAFSTLTDTGITGLTQCIHVNSSGLLSGTGSDCGSGGGAVTSVTNSDGTLTISPTTGAVVSSLNLAHANTWTALQTFGNNISIGGVTATGATGTGNNVFSISPVLTTPNLGTPSAVVLTNATGLPNAGLVNSSITIGGTSVALGGSTSSLPSPGAIGGTTPASGAFTTLSASTSMTLSAISGSTQCLHVNSSGLISGTGSDCGAGGSTAWSALTAPTGTLALSMSAYPTTFTYSAATGNTDMMKWTDTASNTGSGILVHVTTASGSSETPLQIDANGVGWQVNSTGQLASTGATASGTVALSGSTSGTITQTVPATAGTATVTWGSGTGTPVVTATAPLSINTTTGNASLAGAAGQIPNGATGAFTATPTLGASGTLGSLTLGNATSGTVTVQPVTGALGTVTASLPANTGTLAETNLAQTFSAVQTISATNGLVLSAMTGTNCLEEVSGVVTSTGSPCGSGSSGVSANAPLWLQFIGTGGDGAGNCSGNLTGDYHYTTFTVAYGNTCTVNSNAGLVIHATGACTIAGTLTGSGTSNSAFFGGSGGGGGGGSTAGASGTNAYSGYNNGGPTIANGGSAGAASGGTGGAGAAPGSSLTRIGVAGAATFDGTQLGGGPGGGGGNGGGAGGNSGAGITLICASFTGTDGTHTGSIITTGANGTASPGNNQGSGGGGGGGGVIISSQAAVTTYPTITTTGGTGGSCGAFTGCGVGGTGGSGPIVEYSGW